MSGSVRDFIVHQLARLRLACEALDVAPEDIDLADLAEDQRTRLVEDAALDFIRLLSDRKRRASEASAIETPADLRAAAFRRIAAARRAANLRSHASRHAPRGTKRENSSKRTKRSNATRCRVESRQQKIA